ncbi:hypothetical protein ACA910_010036 [Epithemia clementina (nom. ined.)]
MRLMKHVAGICCMNDHQLNISDDDHPDLSVLLNYDLQALQCVPIGAMTTATTTTTSDGSNDNNNNNPNNNNSNMEGDSNNNSNKLSAVSPLVLAPMTLTVTVSGSGNDRHNDDDDNNYEEDNSHRQDDLLLSNGGHSRMENGHSQSTTSRSIEQQQQQQSPRTSSGHEEVQQLLGLNMNHRAAAISQPRQQQQQQQRRRQGRNNNNHDDDNDYNNDDHNNHNGTSSSHDASPTSAAGSMSFSMPYNTHSRLVEHILSEYIAACRFYGCGDRLNAGVLTTIRFSLPCLRVVGRFHDADMLALAEILFKYVNGPLSFIKRLDFGLAGPQHHAPPRWTGHISKGMHSHGALTLAKVLQMSRYIQEVFLNRNRIGPYGASAIFIACSTNPVISKLYMRRCRVGERGALVMAEVLLPSTVTALQEVDLSANCIGVKGCFAIEKALLERQQRQRQAAKTSATRQGSHNDESNDDGDDDDDDLPTMTIDLEGNLVLQEIMNAVTHGLGILLAILGSYLLTRRASRQDDYRHTVSCAIYSVSLIVLYLSSTLYHSFFSMQHTKYIFEVLDKCAIYILIAGSYTPFLQIVLGHDLKWSIGLLSFLWSCCVLGIGVEAFCPTWKYRTTFSLAMYLGMGWSALACLPEISVLVPRGCIQIMVLGGVAYTSGVPFFVRNNNLDHAVWHVFVLAGSILHWCGIYFYVVDFVIPSNNNHNENDNNYHKQTCSSSNNIANGNNGTAQFCQASY